MVGALVALFVVTGMLAFHRNVAAGGVAIVVRYAMVLLAALLAWAFIDRSAVLERTAERRALDARAGELAARAIAPGSTLACLDAGTGEAVEQACEKALFATPASVAAAVSYVSARLALLADGIDYAKRVDASYAAQLAGLRRAAETDPFGLVAHVLARRDGCTPDACPAFKLLEDTSRVSANLKVGLLEHYVTRHAASWPKDGSLSTAQSPGGLGLPSAISIPRVSIMTAEPSTPPLAGHGQPPVPAGKPPQAGAPPRKPVPPPPRTAHPGQGATPAAPPAAAVRAPPGG
jgi:hypothetical protein